MIYYLHRHWGSGSGGPLGSPPLDTGSQNTNGVTERDVGADFNQSMCSTCSAAAAAATAAAAASLMPFADKMPPVCCLLPETCTLGCILDLGCSKIGMVQPPYPYFGSPPPAHMGIPPVHTDPKTGLPRPPMYATYPAPPGQFPHHLYPEFSQVQWHRPAGYPISSGGFSGSYPPLINSISRLGPPGILPHPGLPHPGMPPHPIMSPGPKQEMMGAQTMGVDNHRHGNIPDSANSCQNNPNPEPEKKKPHIKKPLNAFMLFMKEMRPKVIAECTLRESAAINQILGRRWHALDRGEQSKYYDMARKEKELHLQLYPGWSARDNYASHAKKKKRKKDGPGENKVYVSECTHAKKCRARFGMEQQTQWCKPCRSMHDTKCEHDSSSELETKKSTDV
ncbi:transcription factor 7-like 2 isoform X4 [Haliotis asinina]|uniref:transcription factor 7-like 2 isoform X4 n=1 Tax=Haliotis asinina TaxID=109174 RepID=UPI003531BF0D